jgi:hypothetical protein
MLCLGEGKRGRKQIETKQNKKNFQVTTTKQKKNKPPQLPRHLDAT